tara:strand:+ start:2306 stop:2851 length:546 start_codon:yes stop_codon:yes gene_type:complete
LSLFDDAEKKYKLPRGLVGAVASVESTKRHIGKNGKITKSHAGAIGIMQLMPKTAKWLGVNPYDEKQNVDGGAKYLRQMLDRFDGDVKKAVTAYHDGPTKLARAIENERRTGMPYDNFLDNKESREYWGKVNANIGVNEVEEVKDDFIEPLIGKNLVRWTWDEVEDTGAKKVVGSQMSNIQ